MVEFEIDDRQLAEREDNPSTRIPCVLTLDVSGSMIEDPIDELNEGLRQFHQEIKDDERARHCAEIGIVTFSSGARVVTQISPVEEFLPPTLNASGETDLGEGLHLAVDVLEEWKSVSKQSGISFFRPWMFLFTDGKPTDEWQSAARKVNELAAKKKLLFFGIGVGPNVDMGALKQICASGPAPVRLKGMRFRQFFTWASVNISRASTRRPGDTMAPTDPSTWGAFDI